MELGHGKGGRVLLVRLRGLPFGGLQVFKLALVPNEVGGVRHGRTGVGHRLVGAPSREVLRMKAVADGGGRTARTGGGVAVVMPLLLGPSGFHVPLGRRPSGMAEVIPAVVIPLVGVVRELEAGVDVRLVPPQLADGHVADVRFDAQHGAPIERLLEERRDLGVSRLERNLGVVRPLEVRVEREEIDHPSALRAGQFGDRLQLGDVVANQGAVESERDAQGAQVVERLHLPGVVVAAPPVNRTDGVADAMDRHQEIVNASVGERPREFHVLEVHSVGDDRRAEADVRGVAHHVEDPGVERRLAAHEIDRLILVELAEFVQRLDCRRPLISAGI